MCAIVDANAANEVFWFGDGPDPRPEAGRKFSDWAFAPFGKRPRSSSRKRKPRLVIGGELLAELRRALGAARMRRIQEAQRAGAVVVAGAKEVSDRAKALAATGQLASDDPHVLALALVSGARLLYTNDPKLQRDFKDPTLIRPRGKVYSTAVHQQFTDTHKRLLRQRNLCNVRGC